MFPAGGTALLAVHGTAPGADVGAGHRRDQGEFTVPDKSADATETTYVH